MPPLLLRRTAARGSSVLRVCQSISRHAGNNSRRAFVIPRAQYAAKKGDTGEKDELIVNHFAETGAGSNRKRRRINPEEDDILVDEEAEKLKARIEQLEEELQQLRLAPILSQLSEEDRRKVERVIAERAARGKKSIRDNLEEGEGPGEAEDETTDVGHAPVVQLRSGQLPKKEKIYLDKLNGYLQEAAVKLDDPKIRKELWRWYSLCKQNLSAFLEAIPEDGWKIIYDTQGLLSASNPDRQAHLKTLLEDMLAAGHQLTAQQNLAYMEALFLEGHPEKATAIWEEEVGNLGAQNEFSDSFWELGARMFAFLGEPQKAQHAAHIVLSRGQDNDPRIWLPVIEAWNKTGEEKGFLSAWALYVRLKSRLGASMNMEDYDTVSMSFLNAGRKDLALAVFRDMMLAGSPTKGEDSLAFYRKSLTLVGNLQATSPDPSELNNVSLQALTLLPRRFQNKFFYGSWIKKLIGMGEVDAAAMVAELMYERGVYPDAKHVNGIIGGWLRLGTAESRRKAEGMAESMIEERLDFVRRRNARHPLTTTATSKLPLFLRRPVPPATIETFSILAQYHLRRSDFAKVEALTQSLAAAEIKPNAFFMNHLLYSLLRSHGRTRVWAMYMCMTHEGGVKPDVSTFACLWDCMKVHVDRLKTRRREGFPSCRMLFKEMVAWWPKWTLHEREEVSKEVYNQIIRCFSLSEDQAGTVIALQALRDIFGMLPDEVTARIVVLQVARLGSKNPRARRLKLRDGNTKVNVAKVTSVIEKINERRLAQNNGVEPEALDESAAAEQTLDLITELLRIVITRGIEDVDVTGEIRTAAIDMGVEDSKSVGKYLGSIVK